MHNELRMLAVLIFLLVVYELRKHGVTSAGILTTPLRMGFTILFFPFLILIKLFLPNEIHLGREAKDIAGFTFNFDKWSRKAAHEQRKSDAGKYRGWRHW